MQSRMGNAIGALRARLEQQLFLAAPQRPSRFGRGETAVLLLALLALAIVGQLLRMGPSAALDSLWAEDGQIFLQDGISRDFPSTLVDTYAGYLVLVPRLIGEIGSAVPLREAAAAVALASALIIVLSGLAVWVGSSGLIRNPYLRGTLVALTILSPVASLESVVSVAYVPWYMLFGSFWLLFWRAQTTWGAALGALFLLLTGLSTPGVWFFAPVAALRAVAARDRRDALILGGFAAGAAVQIPVIALNDEPQIDAAWSSDIWTAYLQRVLDGAALGERLGGVAWEQLGWALLIGLLIAAVAGLALGLRRSAAPSRWLAAIALPTSLAMFAFSVYQRAVGGQMAWPEGVHFGAGGRYAIVPALLLASVALVTIDWMPQRRTGPLRGNRLAAVAAVAMLGILAISFDLRDPAARGEPPWGETLEAAVPTCAAEGLAEVRVPTSPPPFGITVPCDQLPAPDGAAPAR
jgi:hypothetical protein